jgi:hypothetical protein
MFEVRSVNTRILTPTQAHIQTVIPKKETSLPPVVGPVVTLYINLSPLELYGEMQAPERPLQSARVYGGSALRCTT